MYYYIIYNILYSKLSHPRVLFMKRCIGIRESDKTDYFANISQKHSLLLNTYLFITYIIYN